MQLPSGRRRGTRVETEQLQAESTLLVANTKSTSRPISLKSPNAPAQQPRQLL
jgi:hypothetical protein